MKTNNKSVLLYAATLSLFILSGCNSDSQLIESINRYESKITNGFFLTGQFVFDENVADMYLGRLTIEKFKKLKNEEMITLNVLANKGSRYAVEVELTDKGKQYAQGLGKKNTYSVKLYNCKVKEITKKDFNEETKVGTCVYSLIYNEVTPFGKIMHGAESGKVHKEKNLQTLKKIDGEWQIETYGKSTN